MKITTDERIVFTLIHYIRFLVILKQTHSKQQFQKYQLRNAIGRKILNMFMDCFSH